MGICNGKLKREAKETGEKTIERRSENYPSLLLQLGVSTRVPSIVLGIDTGVGRGSVGYHTVSIKKGEKVSLEGHIVAKNLQERKQEIIKRKEKKRDERLSERVVAAGDASRPQLLASGQGSADVSPLRDAKLSETALRLVVLEGGSLAGGVAGIAALRSVRGEEVVGRSDVG
jgi:hypothetical protein